MITTLTNLLHQMQRGLAQMAHNGELNLAPEGTLREFEGFTQPDAHDYSEGSGRTIPEPGSAEYVALQNTLDQAEEDANNQCGGN